MQHDLDQRNYKIQQLRDLLSKQKEEQDLQEMLDIADKSIHKSCRKHDPVQFELKYKEQIDHWFKNRNKSIEVQETQQPVASKKRKVRKCIPSKSATHLIETPGRQATPPSIEIAFQNYMNSI